MTRLLILISLCYFPLLCHSQDGIGKTPEQILAMYPKSAEVEQEVLSNKLFIKNKTEGWKREFDFDKGKCLVEKLYFLRSQKAEWEKKILTEGWKYNALWHWYFLKKGAHKYYAEYTLNDWDLDYLLFEIKSAAWMDEN